MKSADSSVCWNQSQPTKTSKQSWPSRLSIHVWKSNPTETKGSLLFWGHPGQIFFPGRGEGDPDPSFTDHLSGEASDPGSQTMDGSIHGSMHASMHGSMDGSMDGSMHGSMHRSMQGSMHGSIHGSIQKVVKIRKNLSKIVKKSSKCAKVVKI